MTSNRDIRQQNAERRLSRARWSKDRSIHPVAYIIGLGLLVLAIVVTS
jgi:hypothetical protein